MPSLAPAALDLVLRANPTLHDDYVDIIFAFHLAENIQQLDLSLPPSDCPRKEAWTAATFETHLDAQLSRPQLDDLTEAFQLVKVLRYCIFCKLL